MLQYALRRTLMMIPVFFLISLLIFLVLNLAPGRPGQAGSTETVQKGSENASESVIIFKRQFDLDKPILLNTRSLLSQDDVRALIVAAADIEGNPTNAEIIDAKERLEDYGNYLVRHLIVLLDDPSLEVQRRAGAALTVAARQPLRSESSGEGEQVTADNARIDAFNKEFRSWKCAEDAPPACLGEVRSQWTAWYAANEADYTWSGLEVADSALFDTRFARYWGKLLRLDLGVSVVDYEPVLPKLMRKLKYSISLSLTSVMLAYLLAVPLGVYSAVKPGSKIDNVMTVGLFMLYSLPTFFTGSVLLKLLSQGTPLALFPTGGFADSSDPAVTTIGLLLDVAWHLALPLATSTAVSLAALSRYARTGVIDVIRADYIRTARAKGLSEPVVIIKHAVRNGMIPILTLLGGLLPVLVSGSVVIEVVFTIPGMGSFLVDSINQRDYNSVMAVLLASSLLTQIGLLLSDLSYAFVDPRISLD